MRLNDLIRQRAEIEDRLGRLQETFDRQYVGQSSMTAAQSHDACRLKEKIDAAQGELERVEEELEEARAVEARLKRIDPPVTPSGSTAARGEIFGSFAEQLSAIVRASMPNGQADSRLFRVQERFAAGMNSGVGTEGGFAVESEFSSEILRHASEVGQIASRCRPWPVGANSNGVKLPMVDETSRATGSRFGGVKVYRTEEGGALTASKPSMGQLEINLSKLTGLVYVSDELVQDSVQLGQFVGDALAEEIAFTLDDEIVNGGGGSQCLGILNSAAVVTVSKESGPQTQDTIVTANIMKMWGRCWARSRRNACWLVNQDAEPQLWQLVSTLGSGGVPIFMPPGGASAAPYSTLMGRPVIPVEQCGTLGDRGDIILADLSQYLLVSKPPKSDVSMHVRFLWDEMTFRFVYRVRGAPMWSSALTPAKGSNSISPFVTLEAR